MSEQDETKDGKSANLGEVSEFYSFAYIVDKQQLKIVAGDLNPNGAMLTFLKLYRNFDKEDKPQTVYDLTHALKGSDLVPVELKGKEAGSVSLSKLHPLVSNLQKELVLRSQFIGKSRKFAVHEPVIRELMQALMTAKLAAKSSEKQDFEGYVQFSNHPISAEHIGFSVKSELGGGATLVNTSGMNSALAYELCHMDGTRLSMHEAEELEKEAIDQGIKAPGKIFISFLAEHNVAMRFTHCKGDALDFNLCLDNDNGDILIAALLLESNLSRGKRLTVPEIIDRIVNGESHPSNFAAKKMLGYLKKRPPEILARVLAHRFKSFLLNFMRGAEVSSMWDGKDTVNGGLIVVNSNAEVFCLDLLTRNSISDYYFKNVFFETPSTGRHLIDSSGAAQKRFIFNENGVPSVYILLQVRSLI